VVVIAGKIHVVGGRAPGGHDTGEHDVFDPATGRWSLAAPIPTPRDHAAGAVVSGVLHVAGGRPGDLAVHEAYDPRTNRWVRLAPLPLGRSAIGGANLLGRFVVVGGEDAAETHVLREVDAFDPGTGRWSRLAPLPYGLQTLVAVPNGASLIVPGGGPVAGPSRQTAAVLTLS
jgi:hypothetical protein